jgi:L-asparaginase
MKRIAIAVGLLVMSALFASPARTAAAPPARQVVIVATGGTIAGAAKSETEAGYKAGAVAVDVLLEAVPQLKELARVRGVQVASVGSQDMSDAIWLKLAAEVNALVASPDVDGVVITHGTDTMEETAYFLNLVVKSDKPVVLTGSMRPATAMSADGPLNIYNAVALAADARARGRGVLVAVNDDVHGARAITKTHTTDVETFTSHEEGLVAVCLFGKCDFFRTPTEVHTAKSEFSVSADQKLPRVDVIYAHADMSPDLIEAAVAKGAKGLVVAGVGDGNMTTPALEALKSARAKGVVVVRASRVGAGIVRRNIEVDDDALGFVAAMALNPPKARVLLKLALTKTQDPARVQDYFNRY